MTCRSGLVVCAVFLAACSRQLPQAGSLPEAFLPMTERGGSGTFQLPTPISLEVPPGALTGPTTFAASERSLGPKGTVGPAFELSPDGHQFGRPVTLKVRLRDLQPRVGQLAARLSWARVEADGHLTPLPSRWLPDGTLAAETSHFSTYGFVSECRATGTGTSFPLSCPAFGNPTVDSSVPVSVDLQAGPVALLMRLKAAAGLTTLTVRGLTAGHAYHLYVDGFAAGQTLTASAAGEVSFSQGLAQDHVLVLQTHPASVELTAANCSSYGTFNTATSTCALSSDIPTSVSIGQGNFTLDCAGHTLGSAAEVASVGLFVNNRTDVAVRNCRVFNAQVAVLASSCTRFVIEGTNAVMPSGAEGGTAFFLPGGTGAVLKGLTAEGYVVGIEARQGHNLTLRGVTLRPTFVGLDLNEYAGAILDGLRVDSSFVTPARTPLVALLVERGSSAEVLSFDGSSLSGFLYGIQVASSPAVADPTAVIRRATVRKAGVGALLVASNGGSELSESTLEENATGLELTAANAVFHNNISGNTAKQVSSQVAVEVSDARPASATFQQGNHWGRTCPARLFLPGTDSNAGNVVDSFPFAETNAWRTGGTAGCVLVAPAIVSPQAGAISNNAVLPISGAATAGATVRVLSNGVQVGSTVADSYGGFATPPAQPLPDGDHELTAVAHLAGGTSAASAPVRVTIDTIAPSAPVLIGPKNVAVADLEPAIWGTAEPSSLVTVLEGATVLGTAAADASGAFSVSSALAAGSHTVRATASDSAGNTSPTSQAISFSVVPVTPSAPLNGSAGHLAIRTMTHRPNPFLPANGPNVLAVMGDIKAVQGLGGNSPNNGFALAIRRTVLHPATGQALAVIDTSTPISSSAVAGRVAVAGENAWDGRSTTGSLLPPGTYELVVQVAVTRTKHVENPKNPKDCIAIFGANNGPCVVDSTGPVSISVTVAAPYFKTVDAYKLPDKPSFAPGRESQSLVTEVTVRPGPHAVATQPMPTAPAFPPPSKLYRYFLRLRSKAGAPPVVNLSAEQEVFLGKATDSEVAATVGAKWDGRNPAGAYVSGGFLAASTLEYIEREYSSLDVLVSEQVLETRTLAPVVWATGPVEAPQAAWNAVRSLFADPITGAVVLNRGASTQLKPGVTWNLKGRPTQLFGQLYLVPNANQTTCALTSSVASSAITSFVQQHPALFGVASGNTPNIQIGSVNEVAAKDGLCLVKGAQVVPSGFPLVGSSLSAIFERGGQLVLLSGDVDSEIAPPTGKTVFTTSDCAAASTRIQAELTTRGLDVSARSVSCGEPVTVRLGTGSYRNALTIYVGSVDPTRADYTTEAFKTQGKVFSFFVDPSASGGGTATIVGEEVRFPAEAERTATGTATVYDSTDPEELKKLQGTTASFPSEDSLFLGGVGGWPFLYAVDGSVDCGVFGDFCPRFVETAPAKFAYAADSTGEGAVTCYVHMQQFHARMVANTGITAFPVMKRGGSPTMMVGRGGPGASSYPDGRMVFGPRTPAPDLCVHEFFHQLEYAFVDPEYTLANNRRMTEATVEGMAAVMQNLHLPFPPHLTESLFVFFPTQEFRRTVFAQSSWMFEPPWMRPFVQIPIPNPPGPPGVLIETTARLPGTKHQIWTDCRGSSAEGSGLPLRLQSQLCVDIVPLNSAQKPIRNFGNWEWDGLTNGDYQPSTQTYVLLAQIWLRAADRFAKENNTDQDRFTEHVAAWTYFALPRSNSLSELRDLADSTAALIATSHPNSPVTPARASEIVRTSFEIHGVDGQLDSMCSAGIRTCK